MAVIEKGKGISVDSEVVHDNLGIGTVVSIDGECANVKFNYVWGMPNRSAESTKVATSRLTLYTHTMIRLILERKAYSRINVDA